MSRVLLDNQVQERLTATIVVEQRIHGMLEGPPDFHDGKSRLANVDVRILWVFDAEPVAALFIVPLPATTILLEVATFFSYADANTLIVELLGIEAQKLD